MKMKTRILMAALLSLATLFPMTGCKKTEKTEESSWDLTIPSHSEEESEDPANHSCTEDSTEDSSGITQSTPHTLNRHSYDLVVPTGTRVMSDEPDLPENIVYWDPSRDLKDAYTLEEATQKYAFIVDHSTLIYTACNELRMSHEFYCADYGSSLFQNSNTVYFLGADGKAIDGTVTDAYLKKPDYTSLTRFADDLGQIYVGNMGYYDPEDPNAPQVTIVELEDDHVFATVAEIYGGNKSNESLYYARTLDGKLFYTVFRNYSGKDDVTNQDRQNFVHYSEILFDHLSPDDFDEPYIYDKLVNTPILGGKHITSFDHLRSAGGKSIRLETTKDSVIETCTIVPDPDDSYLAKSTNDTDWVDVNGMQMRENTASGLQEFVFTIDGTRYYIYMRGRNDNKIDVDSLDALLDLIGECCYIA